ncbi:MAG: DUF4366 domain-containing protein [Lachnospiraceae bacterium]|nr:DUF4366 domain-containing protein [Lachnospiraceae bacterium]
MKRKAVLLSIALMMAVSGNHAVIASAAPSTPEDEVREDASHVGEDTVDDEGGDEENESEKGSAKGSTTTANTAATVAQDPPKVVIPESSSAKTEETVDTTRGKLKITISPEKDGYVKESMTMKIRVEKISTNVPRTVIEKVEARIGAQGSWVDVTDDMSFEVTENCTVYAKVTDQYGNEYEKSRVIKCFDTVPPTLNAAVNEGLLTVTSYDTESGVDCVYVNGYKYVPDKHGVTTIRLQKFDATYQNFYVYAMDKAGNPSTVYTIPNPYWVDPNAETEDDNEDKPNPASELPANATPQTTGQATAEVVSVTNEDGEDITNEVKSKQFYTIVTTDGQQYYLIIDMTPAQDKSGDTENTAYAGEEQAANNNSPNPGIVYFLTSVSNQNLLNVVDDGEQTMPYNSTAQVNGIDPYTMTPVMTQQSVSEDSVPQEMSEPEPKEENKIFGFLGKILGWLAGGIGVIIFVLVFRSMSKKKGKPDQSDDAMYESGEERTSLDELNESED